jgi:uncharacterized protein (TIGR02231 family)
MRLAFIALALASTCLSPAFAAEQKIASHIDAVTVYPSGADVIRVVEAHVAAGDTTLLLDDLPGELDPQSIRVEGQGGEGLEIGSVDSKLATLPAEAMDAQRAQLEKQVQTLQDERGALDLVLADAEYQKKLLLTLVDKQLTPPPTPEKPSTVDATQLGSLLDLVGAKLAAVSKTVHDAQLRQRDIDDQVEEIQTKIAEMAPNQTAHMQVALHLSASQETDGVLRVKYRVNNAGWAPYYDARLTSPDATSASTIEIVRRADVVQSTGENWNDVTLKLSTARPVGNTAAPELQEHEVGLVMPKSAVSEQRVEDALEAAKAPAPATEALSLNGELGAAEDKRKDFIQKQATVEIAGFQALYTIAGRVSVDNTGTSKKVRISTETFDTTLSAMVVPKLDPNAYLTASFAAKSDAPMLPGAVNLYRDGVYMGQGSLPVLVAGDNAKLGFGADELIQVKRVEVKRKQGEEGIISSSHVSELAWDISVKNLHKSAIPVTVVDQMPFSSNQDITVEPMAQMTPPTEKDYQKRRGVMAWTLAMEPQAEQAIKFGYKLSWPQNLQVGALGD